jgi:hypothetical protein
MSLIAAKLNRDVHYQMIKYSVVYEVRNPDASKTKPNM